MAKEEYAIGVSADFVHVSSLLSSSSDTILDSHRRFRRSMHCKKFSHLLMVRGDCEHVLIAFPPYGPEIAEQFDACRMGKAMVAI
jgi:hypothetical protein